MATIRKFLSLYLIFLAFPCVYANENAPGNKDDDTKNPGETTGDEKSKDSKTDPLNPGDSNGDLGCVSITINLGNILSEFGKNDVYLKLERENPSPSIISKRALFVESKGFEELVSSDKLEAIKTYEMYLEKKESIEELLEELTQTKSSYENHSGFNTLTQAYSALDSARSAYENNPTNANLSALNAAESNYASACQSCGFSYEDYQTIISSISENNDKLAQASAQLITAEAAKNEAIGNAIHQGSYAIINGVPIQTFTTISTDGKNVTFSKSESGRFYAPTSGNAYMRNRIFSTNSSENSSDLSINIVNGLGSHSAFDYNGESKSILYIRSENGFIVNPKMPRTRFNVVRNGSDLCRVETSQLVAYISGGDSTPLVINAYETSLLGENISEEEPENLTPIMSYVIDDPTNIYDGCNVRYRVYYNNTLEKQIIWTHNSNGWIMSKGFDGDISKKEIQRIETTENASGKKTEISTWETISTDSIAGNQNVEFSQWVKKEKIDDLGKYITERGLRVGNEDWLYLYEYGRSKDETLTYGRLTREIDPKGSSKVYGYHSDGNLSRTVETFLDGESNSDKKTEDYTYTPWGNDIRLIYESEEYDRRLRLKKTSIGGRPILYHYYYYTNNSDGGYRITEKLCVNGETSSSESASVHIRDFYPPESSTQNAMVLGRLKREQFPDGKLDIYTYEAAGENLKLTVIHTSVEGGEDGVNGLSTKVEQIIDKRNKVLEQKTYAKLSDGTWSLTETQEAVYNGLGNVTLKKRNSVEIYSATYLHDKYVSSETLEDGKTVSYQYDSSYRVLRRTESYGNSSTTIYDFAYDSNDNVIYRKTSGAGKTSEEFWRYDAARNLVWQKDADGYETSWSYLDGGRTVIQTNPNGTTVTTRYYKDGNIKSIEGVGVVNKYYTYTVNSNGTITVTEKEGSADSTKYIKKTYNGRKQLVKEEYPSADDGTAVEIVYSYDNYGRVISKTNNIGRATLLYSYDAMGNLIKTVTVLDESDEDSLSTNKVEAVSYSYEAYDDKIWMKKSTSNYFDPQDPSVVVERTRVDSISVGGLVSENLTTDEFGNTTQSRSILSSGITTKTTTYPNSDEDGVETYKDGLLLTSKDASNGGITTYTYDGLKRLVTKKLPRHENAETYEYYGGGTLLKKITDAAGNATQYEYYAQGTLGAKNLKRKTNAKGYTSYYVYDEFDNVVLVKGTGEYPVKYTYDAFGRQLSLSTRRTGSADDTSGWDTTTFEYYLQSGLLKKRTDSSGESTEYTYTHDGKIATRTWARLYDGEPLVSSYTYNAKSGELSGVTYSDDTPALSYTKDAYGRITSVTDAAGSRTLSYSKSLLSHETIPVGNSTKVLKYLYQTVQSGVGGRIGGYEIRNASVTGQIEQNISYSYDNFGRMDEIYDGSDTFTYTYKTDTNLLEILSQNNRNTVYTYEANRDMIISLDNRSAANTRMSKYGYVYDSLGLRTQRSKAGSIYATQSTDTFSYNAHNELVSQNNTHTYAYDSIGNRTSSTENGVTKTYTTNSLNQYTAIGEEVPVYDADGNQTSDGTKKYVYNAENRLIAVEPMSPSEGDIRIEYSYDYLGRKILKRTLKYINSVAIPQKTEYYIYLGKYEIAVYENGTERTRYLWGLDASQTLEGAGGAGGLLKAVERTGEHAGAKYFRYDAEGNVRQILDSSDNVVAYYEYDPFGKLISKGGTYADANRYRHATKPYDEDTGLYYYTYRHYNPESGRWINRDPIAEEGGLNIYAFCVNNGINLWDLWGLSKSETTLNSDIITKNQLIRELRERLNGLNEHDQRDLRKVIKEIYDSQQNGGPKKVKAESASHFISSLDNYISNQKNYSDIVNETTISNKITVFDKIEGSNNDYTIYSETSNFRERLISDILSLSRDGGLIGKMTALEVVSYGLEVYNSGSAEAAPSVGGSSKSHSIYLDLSSKSYIPQNTLEMAKGELSTNPLVTLSHELSHTYFNTSDPKPAYWSKEFSVDSSVMHSVGYENSVRNALGIPSREYYRNQPLY